ncbi:unnamed protein product [Oppiella nova]|uniref:Inosine/uridine-preferring nucleoside hydrolase domain-containing protein n=1 Tax=Oppiella nova TaxID=334625 RepID=A0A7R9QGW4_9ACAR|nr:unnamed protein product [Oppiella nova]CAG2165526.1 unnamed protein product [Oppiella nova]
MDKQENYVIIDTDCGIDDALALMLAFDCHKRGLIEILGITCVYGNVCVDKVVRNNVIKVFKGCENPLKDKVGFEDGFMGVDGLGNSVHTMPDIEVKFDGEHAIQALIRLAKLYPKQISLLTLGPLTNIAMAHQLDPLFMNNLKQIVTMGGLLDTLGNVGPTTEFNYFNDPEAVHVVLANSQCPLTIVPWDTSLKLRMPWKDFDEIISDRKDNEKSDFIYKIYDNMTKHHVYGRSGKGVVLCDILVVLTSLFPQMATLSNEYPVAIELAGHLTRGQLVTDRTGRTERKKFSGHRKAYFLLELDVSKQDKLRQYYNLLGSSAFGIKRLQKRSSGQLIALIRNRRGSDSSNKRAIERAAERAAEKAVEKKYRKITKIYLRQTDNELVPIIGTIQKQKTEGVLIMREKTRIRCRGRPARDIEVVVLKKMVAMIIIRVMMTAIQLTNTYTSTTTDMCMFINMNTNINMMIKIMAIRHPL